VKGGDSGIVVRSISGIEGKSGRNFKNRENLQEKSHPLALVVVIKLETCTELHDRLSNPEKRRILRDEKESKKISLCLFDSGSNDFNQ
jgi:hypothetical protein